jgi:hypothetical protein
MLHAIQLSLQLLPSGGGQPIGLFLSGRVFLFEALDPHLFQESAESPVERSGAQPDSSVAESVDVPEEGISVARFIGQAHEDQ